MEVLFVSSIGDETQFLLCLIATIKHKLIVGERIGVVKLWLE